MKFLEIKKFFIPDSFNQKKSITPMKVILTILTLLYAHSTVTAQKIQNIPLEKANAAYDNFFYIDAIDLYKDIIVSGNSTVEVYQKLADCYYYNTDLKNAGKYYEKMWEKKNEIEEKKEKKSKKLGQPALDSIAIPNDHFIETEYYFRTAHAFKHSKEYKKANKYMELLKEKSKTDSRAKRLVDNPEYLEEIAKQANRYTIRNSEINSLYTDFAPTFYKNKLVFSSSRKPKTLLSKKNEWTDQSYLKLFYASKDTVSDSLSYALEFSKRLNSRLHESTSAFSKNDSIIYFTRNNLSNLSIKKDSTGVSRLKLVRAKLNDKGKWGDIEELPFNSDQYSVAHPTLSPDGKKLYFASDMPGGYGMSDLYVVDINTNGSFDIPRNLGPVINTEGRDSFPFISDSGMLYFASDGHLGLGGFDIFTFDFNDEEQIVYNVGEPVNSPSDDITFIIDDTTKKGYFASNRNQGKGGDDIYSFIETTPLNKTCDGTLEIIVLDETTLEPCLLYTSDAADD